MLSTRSDRAAHGERNEQTWGSGAARSFGAGPPGRTGGDGQCRAIEAGVELERNGNAWA